MCCLAPAWLQTKECVVCGALKVLRIRAFYLKVPHQEVGAKRANLVSGLARLRGQPLVGRLVLSDIIRHDSGNLRKPAAKIYGSMAAKVGRSTGQCQPDLTLKSQSWVGDMKCSSPIMLKTLGLNQVHVKTVKLFLIFYFIFYLQ